MVLLQTLGSSSLISLCKGKTPLVTEKLLDVCVLLAVKTCKSLSMMWVHLYIYFRYSRVSNMFMFYQLRCKNRFCFILERTLFLILFQNDCADSESERCFILRDSQFCSKSWGFSLRNTEIMSWKEP